MAVSPVTIVAVLSAGDASALKPGALVTGISQQAVDGTGVIQTIHGTRLPNERRKKLREAWEAYYDPKNGPFQGSLVAQLWGRAVEAAKVERKYEGLRNSLKAILFSPKK